MSVLAVALVLTAAFMHASWNLLAKRAAGGVAFVWLFGALSACLYAPIALVVLLWQRPEISPLAIGFMAGSGTIHATYFLLLQRGYQIGDLSLVYPLARGTGPLFATIAAIALLGERPTPIVLLGGLLIACGIVLFTAKGVRTNSAHQLWSIGYALLTGICIALYTLWDKYAVSQLLIPPLLLDWSSNLTRALLLMPLAARNWTEVKREWNDHRFEVIGVACLCPLAYILVLTALVFSPVSAIAPAREISIVIGAGMGAQFLAEGQVKRRLFAAGLIVLGVAAIAIG